MIISNLLIGLETFDQGMSFLHTHSRQRRQVIATTHYAQLENHPLREIAEVEIFVGRNVRILKLHTLAVLVHLKENL